MKIKKLLVRNIASIADAELDFSAGPLKDESLFLICGKTGSGKTTILDAICLALYGQTPRYAAARRTGVDVGGLKSDDPRQLVRHGAASASAVLTLEGNDGRQYEAAWRVEAISRGKNKGRLNGEEWVWRDCSPGGLAFTQRKECEAAALRAVGLDFSQFCRTTLLAQGQFTRFLLGTDEEKAKILEKLTDTSRYSGLGMKIKEAFTAAKNEVAQLDAGIGALQVLGEEARAEAERRMSELAARIEEDEAKLVDAAEKADWLAASANLASGLRDAKEKLKASCSSLKTSAAANENLLRKARGELDGIMEYLERNACHAGMYGNSAVIAANLRDARAARADKARREIEIGSLERARPGLERSVVRAGEAKGEAERKAQRKNAEIERAVADLEKTGLSGLRKEKEALEKKVAGLMVLKTHLGEIEGRRSALGVRGGELEARRAECGRLVAALPGLESAMLDAKERFEKTRSERDAQKSLIDDGIKKIVAELKVGDACPVCGNKIAKLNGEAYFTELVGRLNAACREAERAFREKENERNAALAQRNELEKAVQAEGRRIAEEAEALRRLESDARRFAQELGIAGATAETAATAIADYRSGAGGLAKKIEEGEKKEVEIKRLREEAKKLVAAFAEAKDAFDRSVRERDGCEQKIAAARAAAEDAGARADGKIAEAAEKISIAGWRERWEEDYGLFEQTLEELANEFRGKNAAKAECVRAVERLEAEGKSMAECLRQAAEALPELAAVAADGRAGAVKESDVYAQLGGMRRLAEDASRHEAKRPKSLVAADGVESLRAACDALKKSCDGMRQAIGGIEKSLQKDDEARKLRGDLLAKKAAAEKTRDEWKPLYDWFGDDDGKKVRMAIQAYVLQNVLVKANAVLARLADRYELSCEGLTLTVRDSFEGGVERPVDTLSGGEGFLVSLALALGLSGVNGNGLGVDMLFIDEGFGTLSGEHLDRAIDALENLNAICGSRKVGVISHVERLREKIRVHIEVRREGQEPSTVRVVSDRRTVPCSELVSRKGELACK